MTQDAAGHRRRMRGTTLRAYAELLVEHERVRRNAARGRCRVTPNAAALRWLRKSASAPVAGHRAAVVRDFCSGLPEGDGAPPWLQARVYQTALDAALVLLGDQLIHYGSEPVWGKGKPRAPQNRSDFEATARTLRDLDADANEFGSIAAILDSDALPMPRARPPRVRVTLDLEAFTLRFGRKTVVLPEGGERDLVRELMEARDFGLPVPVMTDRRHWKTAVDSLRRRIRRETGENLLHRLVCSARPPAQGYRLHPDVRVKGKPAPALAFHDDMDEFEACR